MKKKLKTDLHIHTTEDPFEIIKHDAFQLIDAASQKGFDVLAITNHNTVTFNKKLESYAEKRNILLIPGMEATLSKKHILIINPDFKKNPFNRSLKDLEKIKNDKNLIIAPHPFFPTACSLKSDLFTYLEFIDAIEFSHYYNHYVNCNKKAIQAAHQHNKPLISTSDCHFLRGFGKNYSLVEAKKDPSSIIEAIKAGKFEIRTAPLHLMTMAKIAINFSLLKRYKRLCRVH